MSWLARSLANSLRLDDGDGDSDGDGDPNSNRTGTTAVQGEGDGDDSPSGQHSPGRGVKEDLSELTKTLTRQLWGVASFLAPPPQSRPPEIRRSPEGSPPPDPGSGAETSDRGAGQEEGGPDSPRIAGIRSDFAEIGGRFRSGISKLSSNKTVTEISKLASTFLPFGSEGYEEEEEEEENHGREAVGVTEEVLAFARNISMHPETWLDFPLLPEEEESDDFDMSDAQQEHALAVEHFAPRLAALRIELCPSHMSEGCFWKIYFVLLHPRLNKDDAERLSTPQIVEARALLLQELQNRTKSELYMSERSTSYRKDTISAISSGERPLTPVGGFHEVPLGSSAPDIETEKHPLTSTEIKIVDKSVIEEELPNKVKSAVNDSSEVPIQKFEDDGDDWLQDDTEIGGLRVPSIPVTNEEDVSFSDLEDEDDQTVLASSKTVSQAKESKDWVQLPSSSIEFSKDRRSSSPETRESSDWLDVDDIDLV